MVYHFLSDPFILAVQTPLISCRPHSSGLREVSGPDDRLNLWTKCRPSCQSMLSHNSNLQEQEVWFQSETCAQRKNHQTNMHMCLPTCACTYAVCLSVSSSPQCRDELFTQPFSICWRTEERWVAGLSAPSRQENDGRLLPPLLLCWALTPLWSLAKYWSTTDLVRAQLLWSDDHVVVEFPKMLKAVNERKILLFQPYVRGRKHL